MTSRTSGRVVVISSINRDLVFTTADFPAPGETLSALGYFEAQGGKGANQAVASARDGAEVIFIGAIGNDRAADAALIDLQAEGIDTDHVARVRGLPTGRAAVTVSSTGENSILVLPGANSAVSGAMVTEALERLALTEHDVCVVSFEVPEAAVSAAARAAHAIGALLILNPSPYRPIADDVWAASPIIVANETEATELTGGASEAAAAMIGSRSGAPAVVTMGASGALLFTLDGSTIHEPGHSVSVVDTTGAGDTFMGVLAAALARGESINDGVARAMAAAALSVGQPGAQSAMPRSAAIETQMARSSGRPAAPERM